MRRLLILLPLLVILVGCGGGNDKLVGTWTGQMGPIVGDMEFKGDGTVEMTMPVGPGEVPGLTQEITFKAKGNYSLSGESLTMTMESADVENLPAEAMSRKEQVIGPFRTALKLGTPQKTNVTFDGTDKLSMKDRDGTTVTLTRKK